MDYPKSVPGVGLVDGKFVDENPGAGQVGSLIPSKWGNDLTDEVLNVLREAGIDPDEATTTQLRDAVIAIAKKAASIGFTPVQQGTGAGQGTNTVKIGWAKDGSGLRVTVDVKDLGAVVFAGQLAAYATQAWVNQALGSYASQQWVKSYAVNKATDTMGGTLYSSSAKYDGGAYRVGGDIGGTFDDWNRARPFAIQVDAQLATGAYGVWRVTRWGARHLAAVDVYEGGSDASNPTIVYHIGAQTNAWTFSRTDIVRGAGGVVWGSWNFDPAIKANQADLNWTNGQLGAKANAGARVQWDSGLAEFDYVGSVNSNIHGQIDLPAPWVVTGMRVNADNRSITAIWQRGVVLRNQ
ncbi:hypothetical protein [Burkholderia vietnamiensis]|uniref:hypothetical protein n=1 Tax=Burkholderia vietnamiensis TaxID=60552 RepID=UPI001CF287BD|nr:hypothetical protein [Burkholderia vietnamiensis]MCA7946446.1 hypothetical protein [Burkholderia vietnamiensis]